MAFIDPLSVNGVKVVARQVIYSSLSSTAASEPTFALNPSAPATTIDSSRSGSATSSAAAATDTTTNTGTGGGGQSSSPLLFFVALGFGVVFTNLWIIVGVKYCLRYNARNRQLRATEDAEGLTMDNVPRPHRRRREKKLMTMDEVNEKFPMVKYKAWVVSRAQQGLPTRGGVSALESRANSVRSVAGVIPDLAFKEMSPVGEIKTAPETLNQNTEMRETYAEIKGSKNAAPSKRLSSSSPAAVEEELPNELGTKRSSQDKDDDEDHIIDAALPTERIGTSGDTCAICIDMLEDDDDVRGLTCGHPFHAVCLDPWLTSRRASCPLCKAEYYTPKLRAAPTAIVGYATNGVIAVDLPRPEVRSSRRTNTAARTRRSLEERMGVGQGRDMLPRFFFSVDTNRDRERDRAPTSGEHGGFLGRFRREPLSSFSSGLSRIVTSQQHQDGGSGSVRRTFGNIRSTLASLRPSRRTALSSSDEPFASGADNVAEVTSTLEGGTRTDAGGVRT